MRLGLRDQLASFERRYGCRAVSIRGHSTIWVGWTEMAQYLAAEGIRLDVNFAPIRYFDRGYLNGSGLPVRFMDSDGRFIDLYEQVTISTDDGWRTDKTFLPARSLDQCIADSRRQADDARDRYHTVYHPYFHPISLDVRGLMPWFDAMLAYTAELPRFSDADWVAFNDARRALRLEALDWGPAGASAHLRRPCRRGGRRCHAGLRGRRRFRFGGRRAAAGHLPGTRGPAAVRAGRGAGAGRRAALQHTVESMNTGAGL